MSAAAMESPAGRARKKRPPVVSSPVLGMGIFIFTEVMFFSAFISSWVVVSAGATAWPPPDQPRLPVTATAFNTAVLLGSAFVLWFAHRAWKRQAPREKVARLLLISLGMGAFFVAYQGFEWVRLLRYGLTLTSSTFGGFFYVIIGAHALHAVAGLAGLAVLQLRHQAGTLTAPAFHATQFFWYFVAALWPVLYWLVYLS